LIAKRAHPPDQSVLSSGCSPHWAGSSRPGFRAGRTRARGSRRVLAAFLRWRTPPPGAGEHGRRAGPPPFRSGVRSRRFPRRGERLRLVPCVARGEDAGPAAAPGPRAGTDDTSLRGTDGRPVRSLARDDAGALGHGRLPGCDGRARADALKGPGLSVAVLAHSPPAPWRPVGADPGALHGASARKLHLEPTAGRVGTAVGRRRDGPRSGWRGQAA